MTRIKNAVLGISSRIGKSLLSFAVLGATFFSSSAQECRVTQLTVNTGYTYPSGGITPGANDPHWYVSSLSSAITSIPAFSSLTPPYAAIGSSVCCGWVGTNPNAKWISFTYAASYAAWYKTTALPADYSMVLSRDFTLCQSDNIRVNLDIARDNWIRSIKVDGTTIWSETISNATGNMTAYTTIAAYTATLAAGTHTISVDVVNFHVNSLPNEPNPHGLSVVGTVSSTTGTASIVNDNACPTYVCPQPQCDETCFWKLTGNTIASNNNIFGTNSNNAIRIKTNNIFRGIMDSKGQLGWNTMTPTAYLHVNCLNNNPNNGVISDVRFENLENGTGNILAIDNNGYVYNTNVPVATGVPVGRQEQLEQRISELEAQIKRLSEILKVDNVTATTGDWLEQNAPNPTGEQTIIGYFIKSISANAYIIFTDINGREVHRIAIQQAGKGQITINSRDLVSGNYIYTLYVDGKSVDSKRMVVKQ